MGKDSKYPKSNGISEQQEQGYYPELRPAPQEEAHAWHWKSSKESVVGELTGPRGEPTTIVLLNKQSIYLPLYLHGRLIPLSDLIKEASLDSGSWLVQKLTTGPSIESVSRVLSHK